jgi:hypothetical protein
MLCLLPIYVSQHAVEYSAYLTPKIGVQPSSALRKQLT